MIKIIHKLLFTLISTIWIVIIYGIDQKWNFLNQSIFLTDVCLIAMPFILIAFWIIITKAGCSSDNVSNWENIDEVNNDFLANYLGYFFIGIGLKIPRGKTRTGSSPVSGTIERMSILRHSFLVF